MKTRAPRIAASKILLGISVLLISSCTQHYFQYPQPIDRKNVYHFPRTFRGSWEGDNDSTTFSFSTQIPLDSAGSTIPPASDTMDMIKSDTSERLRDIERTFPTIETEVDSTTSKPIDSATYPAKVRKDSTDAHDADGGSFIIKRKCVQIIGIYNDTVNKNSVVIAGTKEHEHLKGYYEQNHRGSDSVPDEIKKANYYLKGDLIYEIEDGKLSPGHKYDSSGKEFIIHKIDTAVIELGHYAFLRKLNRKFWVFNFSSQVADDLGWWDIKILEKTKHGTMRIWDCDSKLETDPLFRVYENYDRYFYFDCRWSAAEMLQLIQQGYFTPGDIFHRKH